jgi:hypothetical protein
VARELPGGWPRRPKGFYAEWPAFCSEVVSARLKDAPPDVVAALLLAAGAVLGGAGMLALVAANSEAIDSKGREWGIENLSTIVGVGGALVGAAVGGFGIAWLTRMLGRQADPAVVAREQERLVAAKQEFESLAVERTAGRLPVDQHRLAVERLYWTLTST